MPPPPGPFSWLGSGVVAAYACRLRRGSHVPADSRQRIKSYVYVPVWQDVLCKASGVRRRSGDRTRIDDLKGNIYKIEKAANAINVGINAARASLPGEIVPPNALAKMLWPAGFGALAITVSPPPTTAPATTAY